MLAVWCTDKVWEQVEVSVNRSDLRHRHLLEETSQPISRTSTNHQVFLNDALLSSVQLLCAANKETSTKAKLSCDGDTISARSSCRHVLARLEKLNRPCGGGYCDVTCVHSVSVPG
jgi:hypothetical protein